MYKYIFLAWLVVGTNAFGQGYDDLKKGVAALDKALLLKDTAALNGLLHPTITYGHSNGWVQTKTDVSNDLVNGKLSYNKIKVTGEKWEIDNNWATIRSNAAVEYVLNGKVGEMNLKVLQVWWKTMNGWVLIARQSVKVE